MPCMDYMSEQEIREQESAGHRKQLKEQKKRLDLATRAACAMEKLLTKEQINKLDHITLTWLADHRERDRKRKEQATEKKLSRKLERETRETAAALRRQALAKLSTVERKALGL